MAPPGQHTRANGPTGTGPNCLPSIARTHPARQCQFPAGSEPVRPAVLAQDPAGVVTVQAEGGTFSNAACFTSLDGVSFAP
jgi:hypothetical protein